MQPILFIYVQDLPEKNVLDIKYVVHFRLQNIALKYFLLC